MALSILLAHSDPEEASRLQQALTEAGMEVLLCRDAMSTLARTKKTKPDALVLADDLPDASGFDLCDSVRRKNGFAGIPAVLLVAPAGESDAEAHRDRGAPASAYLPRPADGAAIIEQLRALLKPAEPAPVPPPLRKPPPPPQASEPSADASPFAPTPVGAPETEEPHRPERPSGTFEGLPNLPPLPKDLPVPELPPLPPPNPLAEGDPFLEPPDARPPKGGSPDDKVSYFRALVKSKDETLTRARGVFAAKQQEVMTLREQVRLREQKLADLHQVRENELLAGMRTRELAFLDHLRMVHEDAEKLRARLEAEGRDERKLLGEKQRKEIADRDTQLRQLQVALEEVQSAKVLALEEKNLAERERANAAARLEALQYRTNQLEQSVDDAVQRRDEANQALARLQEDVASREEEIAHLTAARQKLEGENEGLRRQYADLATRADDLEERAAERDQLSTENESLRATQADLQGRLDELADQSRSHLGEANRRADALDTQLEAATEAKRQAEEVVAGLTRELESARSERDANGRALISSQDDVAALTQSRGDLEHRLLERTEAHDHLATEQVATKKALEATKKELEAERRAHNAAAVAEIDAREKLEEQAAALSHAQAVATSAESARAALSEEHSALRATVGQLQANQAKLAEQVDELDSEAKALERSAAETDDAHAIELEEMSQQRGELEKALAEQMAAVEALRKREDELSQQASELRDKLEIEEMQSRALAGLQKELDEAHHELDELRPQAAQVGALEQKRQEAEKARAAAEKTHGERRAELERAAQGAEVRLRDLQGRLDRAEAELHAVEGGRESEAEAAQTARARIVELEGQLREKQHEMLEEAEAAHAAQARIVELDGQLRERQHDVEQESEGAHLAQERIVELEGQLREKQHEVEEERARAEKLAQGHESLEQQVAAQKARAEAAAREAKSRSGVEAQVAGLEAQIAEHEEAARTVADAQEQERLEADWDLAVAEDGHRALADELAAAQARVIELEEAPSPPDPRAAGLEAEVERLRGEVERLKRDQHDARSARRDAPAPLLGPPVLRPANGRERATTLESPATHEMASSMDEAHEDHTSVGPAPLPPSRGPEPTRRRVPEAPLRRPKQPAPPVHEAEAEEEERVEHTTIAPAPLPPDRNRDKEPTLPKGRARGRSKR